MLYVLDEPSIGLHQRDNDRLLTTLKRLRDLGNTVIVVEHDEDAIRTADYVVDIGPGAGVHGGEVVAEGTLKQMLEIEEIAHRRLSHRHSPDRGPGQAPQGQRQEAHRPRCDRQQSAERYRLDPARHLHLHHRRVGLGQIVRFTIDTLYASAAPDAQRRARDRRARMTRSPASNIATR